MDQKATFGLGVILRETGINADTLRAWERRYKLPQPARSEGGQRLYSSHDIEIIKWLLQRQKEGMRIGQAVKLWKSKIAQGENSFANTFALRRETPIDETHFTAFRESWVAACLSFNENAAEEITNEAFARVLPERAFQEIFIPAIRQIGNLWYQGSVTVQQEHFASALIARRLNALIAAAPAPTRPEKVIIGCPPKEEHTLGLLLTTLYLRRRGFNTIYLGANIPLDQFTETAKKIQPQLIILAAQQLISAATLKNTADILSQSNIPVAYSGRIFIDNIKLREKINAYFLGEKPDEVLQNAESLLSQNHPSFSLPEKRELYQSLIKAFKFYRPNIHVHFFKETLPFNLARFSFHEINNFMSENILAALQLGNLDLLKNEFAWASTLIENHEKTQISGKDYLQLYANAIKKEIGDEATLLIDWLLEEASR
ncbi:MAG: MerR family transcriptional regulator [Chloroflexi bacterium]|nr:MerR family transcriptional regulator [Chloroflexota bacterium]